MKRNAPWRNWKPCCFDGPVMVCLSWTTRELKFPSLAAAWQWEKGRTPGVKAVTLWLPTLELPLTVCEVSLNDRPVVDLYRRSGRWLCVTKSRSSYQLQELVDAVEWLKSQPR